MILHEYRINYKHRGTEFRIKPCFDWHVGHRYCDIKALKKYLYDGADDPFCYLVTGGDLLDSIVITDPRYSKSDDDSSNNKERVTKAILDVQYERVKKLLLPYKGRIIGVGLGNHENTVLKEGYTHLSRRLAEDLETTSLGYQWAVQIRFCRGITVMTLTVFGHHGWGGGSRTEGGSITKYSNHALRYEADIFLYGHDHQRKVNNINFMGIQRGKYIPKDKRVCMPGTFLRTFSNTDEPTWAETRGFNPVTIGGLNLFIKPERTWFDIWSDL